jgi:hypothetical protein
VVKRLTTGSGSITTNSHAVWKLNNVGAPTAEAGDPIFADLSTTPAVTLDGSKSKDTNGNIAEYIWNVKRGAAAEAEEYTEAANVKISYAAAASGRMKIEKQTAANTATARYFVDVPVSGTYSAYANSSSALVASAAMAPRS